MMLGDLGARVIKVENPGTGDDTRGWGRRSSARRTTRRLDVLPVLQPQQGVDRAGPQERRRARRADPSWCARADVLLENFRPGVLDRLGFSAERLHELNPRAGRPVDHRVRPRRARGRPGRLRPDRPGRGRADVADRLRAGRPAAGRRADRRPARRHVRRVRRRSPRCYERERTGRGQVVRTSLLAADRRRARLPGHPRAPSPARCRRRQGNHHPSIAPYGLFRCRTGSVQIAWAARGCGRRSRRVRPRPRRAGDAPPTPSGCATATRSSPRWTRPSPTRTPAELLPELAEAGVPAGKVRTLDEVYEWDQTRSQGLLIDVDHPMLGRIELPGPPLRFFDADATPSEPHRRTTRPAGCSDQHDASVRAWLGRDGRHHRRGPRREHRAAGSAPASSRRGPRRRAAGRAGTRPSQPAEPAASTPPSWRPRADKDRHGRVRHHRRGPASAAAGSPWSSASSASSPGRSGSPRPSGSSPPSSGPPAGAAAARRPGLRRHPDAGGHPAFVQMVKITAAVARAQGRPACPTSSTCATPPPAACSPPGGRSATSPSPSRAR